MNSFPLTVDLLIPRESLHAERTARDSAAGFMHAAVDEALKGKWSAAPNPCVGAVLVKDDRIVASGFHTAYGKPHAEVECLTDARNKNIDPAQCSLYVTLEPCNHMGKTPPCTKAILDAGVKHVVVGAADPNPNVSGGGIQLLRDSGVNVDIDIEADICRELIADFITWSTTERPYCFLKTASTLDGKIATATGDSQWVTGRTSRNTVHALRGKAQAVIVGGNTFYTDNPRLTPRGEHESEEHSPLAVVVTTRLPSHRDEFHLLRERSEETIFWTSEECANSEKARRLEKHHVRVLGLPQIEAGLDLGKGMTMLRQDLGCHYVMCEGGGRLGFSLLQQGLVDELWHFTAPKILGDHQGVSVYSGRMLDVMSDALTLDFLGARRSGKDVLHILRPKTP